MTVRRHVRLAIATTIAATGIALVTSNPFGTQTTKQANQLCYSAGVSGNITGTHDTPRVCQNTSLPVLCTTPSAGLLPTIEAHAEACIPD